MTEMTPIARRLRRAAPLAIAAVLLAGCGDDDKGAVTSPTTQLSDLTTTKTTPTPTPKVPPGSIKAGKGTLVADRTNLLPLLGQTIQQFAPTQAEGTSLRVISLVGSDAFWAGRSARRRILVKMRLKGGSAPEVKVGQKVDFIGMLTAVGADAGALGVASDADNALLTKQGAYVDASAADVKPH